VPVDPGPLWTIPNLKGGISGTEAAPNRRGAELAGLTGAEAETLLSGNSAEILIVADSDFGQAAHDPQVVERLRRAKLLIVFGWCDSPLAKAADIALPVPNHAEKDGTFVNVEWRLQHFAAAYPSPGQDRPMVDVLVDLLARFDPSWSKLSTGPATGKIFDRLAGELPAFAGLSWDDLPAVGVTLNVPQAHPAVDATAASVAQET
jgi:predicted molibdopterin-dependent oxidoreductase YjgC